MHLTLLDHNDQVVADMINDDLKLGYFSPMDGYTIHITDLDPNSLSANGGLEDVSLVKKYEISEEATGPFEMVRVNEPLQHASVVAKIRNATFTNQVRVKIEVDTLALFTTVVCCPLVPPG